MKILPQIAFIFLLTGIFAQCSAQDRAQNKPNISSAVSTGVAENRLADELQVVEQYEITVPKNATQDVILSQSAPVIALSLPCDKEKNDCVTTTQIELPEVAQKIVAEYWKSALAYRLDAKKVRDAQNSYNLMKKHSVSSEEFRRAIREIDVQAPSGTRKISHAEAEDITAFINMTSHKVVEHAKSTDD